MSLIGSDHAIEILILAAIAGILVAGILVGILAKWTHRPFWRSALVGSVAFVMISIALGQVMGVSSDGFWPLMAVSAAASSIPALLFFRPRVLPPDAANASASRAAPRAKPKVAAAKRPKQVIRMVPTDRVPRAREMPGKQPDGPA